MHRNAGALTSAGAGGAAAAGVGPAATGALLVTCAAEQRTEDLKVLLMCITYMYLDFSFKPKQCCMQAIAPLIWSCTGTQGTRSCR